MGNRCKAKTNAGARCKKGAGDNGLCGTHRSWCSRDNPFGGLRVDAGARLPKYLEGLKKGKGRAAAAADVGVAYETIIAQRARRSEFARLEIEAESVADAKIDDALFKSASKGNVGAAVFWSKIRRGWSDVSRVEIVEQVRRDEFGRVLQALSAAGVTDEQLAAAEAALKDGNANTVH